METCKIKITVDDGKVVIAFDRSTDYFWCSWRDALTIAQTMDKAVAYLPLVVESVMDVRKQCVGVKLTKHEDGVAIRFSWSDRIILSRQTVLLVSTRIKQLAKDVYLELRRPLEIRELQK